MGLKVLAEVGYALTCCCLSTTHDDAGGSVNDSESRSGASPAVLIRLSRDDMVYT